MSKLNYVNVAMEKIAIEEGWNVRSNIEQEKIKELASSMKSQGLLHPISIQKRSDGSYTVVAGHRRFLAAKHLNWKDIPAAEVQGKDALVVLTLENLSRENLTPYEEVEAFKRLADATGMSARKIAEKVGVSNVLVSERLKVAAFPELVEAMRDKGLTFKRAVKLAADAKKNKDTTISESLIDGKLDEQDKVADEKGAKRAETIAAKEATTEATSEATPEESDELVTEEQEILASINPELADMTEEDFDDFETVDDFLAPVVSSNETTSEENEGETVNELTVSDNKEENVSVVATVEELPEARTRVREKKALGGEPRLADLTTLLDFIDNAEELMAQYKEEDGIDRGAFLAGTLYGLYMAVGYGTDAIKLLAKNEHWEDGF